jgi:hypothetical protein
MPSQQDLDQGGTFRQYTRVWQGPSVGWVTYPFQAVLEIKVAGTVSILRGTNLVKLNINGNVTLNLPSSIASTKTPQAIPGQWVIAPITIVDKGGFAGGVTYNIVPFGAELISGLANVQLAAPYGTIVLEPLLESGGWNLLQ